MCILSAVVCLPLIVLAGIGFSSSSDCNEHRKCGTLHYGIQIIVAWVTALSAISGSSISCQVVCGGKQCAHPENDTLSQSETEHIKEKLSIKSIKIIIAIQLISALVALITGFIIINDGRNGYIEVTGIWTSFLFALSGLTGLLTAQKPSKSKYVYCVICIVLISISIR